MTDSTTTIILGVGVPIVTGLIGATIFSYQQSRNAILEVEERCNNKIAAIESSVESSKREVETRLNDKIDKLETRLNAALLKIEGKVDQILDHVVNGYFAKIEMGNVYPQHVAT